MRKAAIYARVSTPRQGREQTIESQLAGPKELGGSKTATSFRPRTSTPTRATRAPGSTVPGWTPCVTAPRMELSR